MPATRRELLLAAAVFLAIPVLAELALRIAGTQFEPQLYAPNRDRGWVLRAGASGVVRSENRQFVPINSQGFHDVERSYEKPANTVRIAMLGNSWTEALQVPLEKNFTAVLQQMLSTRSCFDGKRVEVLNFGVAGYSTGQELLNLQQEAWKYHPDMVLLAFYPGRDIANNVRELNNAVTPEQSPYFVLRDGRLVLDDSFRELSVLQPRQMALQDLRYRMTAHVRILQAISGLQREVRMRLAMSVVKEKAQQAGVDNLEYAIYAAPQRREMQDAWQVTEALFLAMRDEVEGHGAEFRIVMLPTRPQVIPDATKRGALMRKLGVADLDYADQRIRDFANGHHIAVVPLAAALAAYAEEHHAYLNGFNEKNFGAGHWNETGHRVAAETIASQLCGDYRPERAAQGTAP